MRKKHDFKESQRVLIVVLLFTVIFAVVLSLPLKGEEREIKDGSASIKTGNDIISTEFTLLQPKYSTNFELSRPVSKESKSYEFRYNFFIKKTDTPLDVYNRLNKRIKSERVRRSSLFNTTLITSAILGAADFVTTVKALKYGSLQEANPLAKPIVKNPYVFALAKLGITALNYQLMKVLYKKDKKLAWVMSVVSNLALSYVVINNIRMIQKAQAM
jgi:energy-converting hydrogenase Eha subunit A